MSISYRSGLLTPKQGQGFRCGVGKLLWCVQKKPTCADEGVFTGLGGGGSLVSVASAKYDRAKPEEH